jgi:hypothetical protein
MEGLASVGISNRPPTGPGKSYVEQSDDNAQSRPHRDDDASRRRDKGILQEAKDRFHHAAKWEHNARKNFLEDIKFSEADAYNGYQWPNDIRRNRDVDERPCLTINKVRQHCLQIINDAKKNKPSIKYRAAGGGATLESANMLNALAKFVERRSHAASAYDTATNFQVRAGIGWWRVITEYEDEETDFQIPRIIRIDDPLMVMSDPDAKEADKSDMKYCFIFEDVDKDEFERQYPQYAKVATQQTTVDEDSAWTRTDYIRVCEYFRVVEDDDTLYSFTVQGTRRRASIRASLLKDHKDLEDIIKNDPSTTSRHTTKKRIEWFFIVGTTIVEEGEWIGKYIPMVPVIGEETKIDGLMDRKGHTRALIDPQRMYNYWSSTAVEYGALQTKSPWVAPAEAIEGYETYWNTANKVNHSVLPYNGLNDAGEPIPKPERVEPPVAAPVAVQGMQIAAQEFMMASGQYADMMGDQSNERSAKAIEERQRPGSTATYHYIDNLAVAVRHTGRILIDLFPKLLTQERVLRILAEDGIDFQLEIDPQQASAYQKKLQHDGQVAAHVLNPSVGLYEVEADIGPNYGTKREETANALTLLLTQAPTMVPLVGDLLLKSMDFELADEAAARLRRMVPAQALGEGPTMNEQALQAQLQNLQNLLQESMQQLATANLKLRGKEEKRDIDVKTSITAQLKALLDYSAKTGQLVNQEELQALLDKTIQEAAQADVLPILQANAPSLGLLPGAGGIHLPQKLTEEKPPVPGARKGRDGHWYVRNYAGSNNYLAVQ